MFTSTHQIGYHCSVSPQELFFNRLLAFHDVWADNLMARLSSIGAHIEIIGRTAGSDEIAREVDTSKIRHDGSENIGKDVFAGLDRINASYA